MNQIDNSPKQESVAAIILRRAEKIAARAEQISNSTCAKLEPIARSEQPKEKGQLESISTPESREFPPLFNELRTSFNNIENSLSLLEEFMTRVEL